jgi:hypothetical protein
MTRIHGTALSADEIETELGREMSTKQAVSLFNTIIWTTGDARRETVPAFTERVNVKDKGVDGVEWDVDVAPGIPATGRHGGHWARRCRKAAHPRVHGSAPRHKRGSWRQAPGPLHCIHECSSDDPTDGRDQASGACGRGSA